MIGAPPFAAGGDHTTVADALPAVAETPVGADGTVGGAGVTGADGVEGGPVPTALVAVTVNVYAVPLVNPPTTTDVAPVVVATAPPGDAVTVYPVTLAPPLLAGGLHDTVADAFPATPATPNGALGTVAAAVVRNTNMPATYPPDGVNPDVVIDGAALPTV